jgi:hypothetical protein
MPLPRWLQPLFPAQTSVATTSERSQPLSATTTTPDPDARIHIAAHDPDFPRKREAAVLAICAAIDRVAAPSGYACRGTTWSRASVRGTTAVNLQRSRYGFEAYLNLRFLPADGIDLAATPWAQDDDIRIASFYLPDENVAAEPGVIFYLDVHEDPASLDQVMRILATRALPWLDAHHEGLPAIEAYMGEQAPALPLFPPMR